MTHPYFARVLLRAGEARRFLVLEPSQASKDLREYSICILERYVEVERRELQKVLSGVYRDEELGVRDGFIQRASVFSSIKRFFVEESDFTLVSSLLFFVLHRDITKEMKTELISNLNLGKIADSIKKTESKRLQTLTNFLRDIQERRDEMMKKLDFVGIADIAMITKAEHLDELRNFLNVLGEHKERFIDEVIASEGVLKKIANVASSIPHNRFHDLANVFDVFGSRKSHLIDLLDIDSLIRTAGQAATEDIRGITLFMSSLDEKTRQRFIREVDWVSLCLMCPIEPGLLRALGGCLENLINQAGMVGDRSRCEKVIHHLENHEDDFVHAIRNAYEQVMNYPYDYAPLYSGVSKFVHNSSKLDNEYAKELVEQTNSKLVECFRIVPRAYYYVGQLLDCFYYIDPSLSYFLLTNKKVRGRIQQSINENDPCKEIRGLRRLFSAF
jgi:hypothetical protein